MTVVRPKIQRWPLAATLEQMTPRFLITEQVTQIGMSPAVTRFWCQYGQWLIHRPQASERPFVEPQTTEISTDPDYRRSTDSDIILISILGSDITMSQVTEQATPLSMDPW